MGYTDEECQDIVEKMFDEMNRAQEEKKDCDCIIEKIRKRAATQKKKAFDRAMKGVQE